MIELICGGDDPVELLLSAFSADPPRDLANLPVGRIVYGQWRSEDVLVIRTSPQTWEIHCHGGLVAIDRILSDLESVGVRQEAGRWNQYGPSLSAETPGEDIDAAITSHLESILIQCRTRKTAAIALAQTDGRLLKLWRDLNDADPIVRQKAEIEHQRWKHVADHLIRPWTVALVGAPNAGKSSLMNAIAGRQRAIVSEIPGTTRDLLEAEVVLDGWPFLFVDSAGIREAAESPIEASGISRSKTLAQTADIVCFVIDRTSPPSEISELSDLDVPMDRVCILLNKSDLPAVQPAVSHIGSCPMFDVSALTNLGLSDFLNWLVRRVVPVEPHTDDCVPILPFCRGRDEGRLATSTTV